MENNTLFHVVLLSLGFDVYFAGARVFNDGKYLGLAHCLNIVTIDDDTYTVDVGFGPNEPVTPLKLADGIIYPHIEPAWVRFRADTIPQNLNQRQKFWIYELKECEGAEWVPMYSFSEMEFLPEDLAVLNYWPQKDRASLFTQSILCTRFTWDTESFAVGDKDPIVRRVATQETGEAITGALILFNDSVKWRKNGEKVVEKKFSNEKERLSVLEECFAITIPDEDKVAILGTTLEIKAVKK